MTGSLIQHAANTTDLSLSHELYSVKKRLLLPRWWLKGVFCAAQDKSALCRAYLNNRSSSLIVGTPMANLKVFYSVAQFWNQVTKQLLLGSEEDARSSSVRIAINEIFQGTRADQLSIFESFRQAVTTPFCLQVARNCDRSEHLSSGSSSRSGLRKSAFESLLTTSLLRNLEIHKDGYIVAEFLASVRAVVEGSCFGIAHEAARTGHIEPDRDPLIVTLNPSVLKWYGDKATIKKLALYFFLELEKNRCALGNGAGFSALLNGVSLGQAHEFFKELFAKAAGLYDHGVLGWHDAPPPGRVADYAQQASVSKVNSFGCVQVVSLSDHLLEVARFEQSIDERFFFLKNHSSIIESGFADRNSSQVNRLVPSAGLPQRPQEQVGAQNHAVSQNLGLQRSFSQQAAPISPQSQGDQPRGGNCSLGRSAMLRRFAKREKTLPQCTQSGSDAIRMRNGDRARSARVADASQCAVLPSGHDSSGLRNRDSGRLAPPAPRNLVDPGIKAKKLPGYDSKPRDQEKEYVLKLAQYYESLSPAQRRDLDHEMRMRSPAELREWLGPILERLH